MKLRLFSPRNALAAVVALALGFCALQPPAGAQSTPAAITSPVISSTAAAGTSGTLALDGKFSNCAVYAQTSTSTATIVVSGNTQAGLYGPAAPYVTNSSFGSSGTITATTTLAASQGNTSIAPVGLFFSWSGNSGTLTAWITCANTSTATFSGSVTANVPTPLPVTFATPLSVTVTAPTDASGFLQVHQVAAPLATTPVSTPSANALPTATAGAAGPGSAPAMVTYPTCSNSGGTAAATLGNFIVLQCDSQGKLYVSVGEPTMTFSVSAAVSSATTTILVAHQAGLRISIYLAAWESSGTNATNTIQWVYSTNASCTTGNTALQPTAVTAPTAASEWTVGWGQGYGNGIAAVTGMPGPAVVPLIIPVTDTFCGITAGTTTAGNFVTLSSIHL